MKALKDFIDFVAPGLTVEYTEKHGSHDQQSHAGGRGRSFQGEAPYAERRVAARDFGLKASAHLQKAPDDQKAAMLKYQSPTFKGINNSLRKGKITKSNEKTVDALDKVFKKASWPEDTEVYRGIDMFDAKRYLKMKPGDVLEDKGYTSTSLVPERAFGYGSAKLKIRVPKGSKAVYPDAATPDTRMSFDNEVLINRGSKFRIVSIKPGPLAHMPGDKAEIELELVVD